jgi:DNA invertase Pin-like site-specific DNA recombinase
MSKPKQTKQTKTTATPAARKPIAISYLRFSTPEQRKGDSIRRQTEASATWCARNDVTLDTTFTDRGVSAHHGKHKDDKAALGRFLQLVADGQVPRGSYLIIENLDRLSREDERTALRLWMDILDAGVNIVQLTPETVFRHDRSDMVDIMRAIIELSRGHSESHMKSVRGLATWDVAVRKARCAGTPFTTRQLPAWVEMADGHPTLIVERAKVVRHIFQLATEGLGVTSIIKKLNADGVPAFGGRVAEVDEEGNVYHKKADGQRWGSGHWNRAYVQSILNDRRATGEFQPRDAGRKAKGQPIKGYYPPVVSEAEFFAARAAIAARRGKPGRIGTGVANLFGGLLRDARDGSTYATEARSEGGGSVRNLRNQGSSQGRARCFTFPLATFERALLSQLRELDPSEVLGEKKGRAPADADVLQGQLEWVRERRAKLKAALGEDDIAEVVESLRGLQAQETDLVEKLDLARQEAAARPMTARWEDAHTLIDLLDQAEDGQREEVRLRLRSAIRGIVSEVWMLVLPKGKDRVCAAQIRFEGGGQREYLIQHHGIRDNGKLRQPGWWRVRSIRSPYGIVHPDSPACIGLVPFDLSGESAFVDWSEEEPRAVDTTGMTPEQVEGLKQKARGRGVERTIELLDACDMEEVFAGCPKHPLA